MCLVRSKQAGRAAAAALAVLLLGACHVTMKGDAPGKAPRAPDDAPLTCFRGRRPRPAEGTLGGSVSREQIDAAIRGANLRIWRCYQESAEDDPNHEGQIDLECFILKSGSVAWSRIGRGTFHDAELESCVGALACEWKFSVEGPGDALVSIPLRFSTSGWDSPHSM